MSILGASCPRLCNLARSAGTVIVSLCEAPKASASRLVSNQDGNYEEVHVQEIRQQLVNNGKKILQLTSASRKLQSIVDFQKDELDVKDTEIQRRASEFESLQEVLDKKTIAHVDATLELEWYQKFADEKDREIQKLKAEVESLRAQRNVFVTDANLGLHLEIMADNVVPSLKGKSMSTASTASTTTTTTSSPGSPLLNPSDYSLVHDAYDPEGFWAAEED